MGGWPGGYHTAVIRNPARRVEQVFFELDIPAHLYVSYYRGQTRNVMVRATDGRRIAFPADKLRPFVTHEGVRGRFVLIFDDQHRFQEMRRIGDLG